MEIIKKNITLILGISIPILMILFVAGSIYLPGLFIKPHFNFLYVSGDDSYYYYNSGHQYSVQNDKLVKNEIKQPENQNYNPPRVESKLYIYDVAKNEAKEISFTEAQNLNLDSSVKSSDDFEVVYGSRDSGFFPFFWGGTDYNARYLSGHNVSKKLNLQLNGSSYYNNFRFIGWIK
ncbi:hypothetical protein HYW32_02235 [Candidatus Berkelbacteria bacterium]|nr:hypothetical protein [Candidatus Berkelbacteria bacterium]